MLDDVATDREVVVVEGQRRWLCDRFITRMIALDDIRDSRTKNSYLGDKKN